jgi:hypothetical protein
MLVGMLVEEGLLSWTDLVSDHLPGFALNDAWASQRVTIADLLAHKTGVPRNDWIGCVPRYLVWVGGVCVQGVDPSSPSGLLPPPIHTHTQVHKVAPRSCACWPVCTSHRLSVTTPWPTPPPSFPSTNPQHLCRLTGPNTTTVASNVYRIKYALGEGGGGRDAPPGVCVPHGPHLTGLPSLLVVVLAPGGRYFPPNFDFRTEFEYNNWCVASGVVRSG